MKPVDVTTIRGQSRTARGPGVTRVPTLTVLLHPDPERVGDTAPLLPRLSRLEPRFRPPGGGEGAPLGDPHVSRRPIQVAPLDGGGLRLAAADDADVQVDGERWVGARTLGPGALDRGVVIQLGDRVVLLAHLRRPSSAPRPSVGHLVGESDVVDELRREIGRVAALEVPVLILGETGAGKEHVARGLHEISSRGRGPFVAVNMSTVPSGTAESQLFGHARGAFTGAERAHQGWFEQADGGTLFLDEIGETPPDVQPMLLRALESGEIRPVGAQAVRRVNARVIAATDADLERGVKDGRFRAPLFHRLGGYTIRVPPLRERRDDVGRLLVYFLGRELAACGEPDRLRTEAQGMPWLPAELVAGLARYDWPGNVRELANVARHLVVVGREAPVVEPDAFLAGFMGAPRPESEPPRPAEAAPPGEPIDDDRLVAVLAAHGWKTGAAARALGISKTTLYALIDRCPLVRKARDLGHEEISACWREVGGDLDQMAERLRVSKRGLQLRIKELGLPRER